VLQDKLRTDLQLQAHDPQQGETVTF